MNQKEKIEKIKEFRLIDDVFFEVFASDIPACQEILRTILEDEKLIVNDVIVQSSERNIYGRSVRLDALCTLGDGSLCNIEIQRSDNDNHLKRARFNAASITVKESEPGINFENVKDVYIVYISEKDFFKAGLTTYHIDKIIRENGITVEDGLHEIFVNAAVDDGSNIAELMQCFKQKDLNNLKFKAVTRRFKELKETEGGLNAMCKIMEDIVKEENEKILKELKEERQKTIKRITKMISKGYSKEEILELDYTEEEYKEAEKELLATV
ncbi:MAG: PD-(D/E)XK nuclease family transposase [Butyribacter sp.]|jgi:hypothetical protein|uniref:PD-(D/E)XK nuclease family transposase n=1 Tax=Butyribacter TaxID=2822463 RepID=UPI00033AD3AD|nr:hypothetical protein [Clostridium sp.]MCQ5167239.1 PD-(D/E)XK nuclease family transposase [Roseburia hominis]CCZ42569.1 putative uncharacterized protein [Clostridium sp. CAG:122]